MALCRYVFVGILVINDIEISRVNCYVPGCSHDVQLMYIPGSITDSQRLGTETNSFQYFNNSLFNHDYVHRL